MQVFYEARQVPVHSCQMLETSQAAQDFPKRDLQLGFCEACGFISNVIFDSGVQDYRQGYEEQQLFSPRFRKFQGALISRLIDRYDLHGKDVIEIGCGKGDFLVELCDAGDSRGIGIDPTCDPARLGRRGVGRVRFIADLYSEQYRDLPCDFLCCRHTLEHIHPVGEFIAQMRRVIGNNQETIVFFEVPDVSRVLGEQAFWDIYYEHCSYFTLGSLARVFRAAGFELIELAKDYDDQYLLIVARPADGPTAASLPEEDDLQDTAREVQLFSESVTARQEMWRSRLGAIQSEGQCAAVWGSGSKCVSFLSTLGDQDGIDAVVDINPHRHGKFLPGSGKRVAPPETLRDSRPDVIFVMNPIYCDEIQQQIDEMGLSAELVPME